MRGPCTVCHQCTLKNPTRSKISTLFTKACLAVTWSIWHLTPRGLLLRRPETKSFVCAFLSCAFISVTPFVSEYEPACQVRVLLTNFVHDYLLICSLVAKMKPDLRCFGGAFCCLPEFLLRVSLVSALRA